MRYRARIRSRDDIQRNIPQDLQGWWSSICPGETLTVRDATQEDIDRCILAGRRSRLHLDYFCEDIDRGALVPRLAIDKLTPVGKDGKP